MNLMYSSIHVVSFTNVTNSLDLRNRLLSHDLPFCWLDGSMIMDLFQIKVAVARALLHDTQQCLTTNTIHSEIVYNIAACRNMQTAFTTFGLKNSSTDIVVVMMDAKREEIENIMDLVHGKVVDLNTLEDTCDKERIIKHYKIHTPVETNLLDAIVTRIAVKSVSK